MWVEDIAEKQKLCGQCGGGFDKRFDFLNETGCCDFEQRKASSDSGFENYQSFILCQRSQGWAKEPTWRPGRMQLEIKI